jgi:RNA-directed DNA polymerase
VRNAREESFDFLGYTFRMQRSIKTGRPYPGPEPSVKAAKRLKASIRRQLHHANMNPLDIVVDRLNRTLRGWANYYQWFRSRAPADLRLRFVQRGPSAQQEPNRRRPALRGARAQAKHLAQRECCRCALAVQLSRFARRSLRAHARLDVSTAVALNLLDSP